MPIKHLNMQSHTVRNPKLATEKFFFRSISKMYRSYIFVTKSSLIVYTRASDQEIWGSNPVSVRCNI